MKLTRKDIYEHIFVYNSQNIRKKLMYSQKEWHNNSTGNNECSFPPESSRNNYDRILMWIHLIIEFNEMRVDDRYKQRARPDSIR